MTAPYLGQIFDADTVGVELGTEDWIIVRLQSNGSRGIVDVHYSGLSSNRPTWAAYRDYWLDKWDYAPIMFWGLYTHAVLRPIERGEGSEYMPYPPADGIAVEPVEDPPNQVTAIAAYRAHAARFAHELDAALGHHSLTSADERDSLIVRQTIAAMIGVAASRYAEWETVDPQELIVGGVYDGTLLWKRNEQDYIDTDIALCGQCNISTLARQLKKKGDLAAFRRGWRQGVIYGIDRTTTLWSPSTFALASSPVEDYYDELDAFYGLMIDHYDEVVGAQV